jgi:hypothetical protein
MNACTLGIVRSWADGGSDQQRHDQRNGPQDIDPSAAHWIHGTVASGGGNRLLIRMRPSASLSLAARGS